ncbi:hypothetical protein ACLB2K_017708 [Fragaria x ananassa]
MTGSRHILTIMYSGRLFRDKLEDIKALAGPKYDGKYLHGLVTETLKDKKLSQTLTNVVIPAFDIRNLQPTIFSSFKMKNKQTCDALLSDICIATFAAPTYLPAHYFKTNCNEGEDRDFHHLIDGGLAANNPTLVAIGEVTKEIIKGSPDFLLIKPTDHYARFLVISLGTGSTIPKIKYDAHVVAKWGEIEWLTSGGSTPLIDAFMQASVDMVDLHLSVVFQALKSEENYLRIQVYI